MTKVKWGILGAGNIAHRFAKALQHVENAELYAISVRNKDKGLEFASKFPCSKVYIDYEDFINDEEIDCVYLSLPHGLHYEYAIKALKKNKYVLCEKPATINLSQMKEIAKCAKENDTFFMEAMKQRFLPIYTEIKKEVEKLGKITKVEANFCRIEEGIDFDNYYYKKDEGGCLLDTGIYCASWLDDFSQGDLKLIKKDTHMFYDIDNYNYAVLETTSGETLILENGKETTKEITCTLTGEKGKIVVYNQHRPTKFTVYLRNQEPYTIERSYEIDDFYSEVKYVNDCYLNKIKESKIMPLDASIRCARIIELIRLG